MDLNKIIQPEKPDVKPAHARKAILWGRNDLLSNAVGLFLETQPSWSVINVPNTGNVENLINKVKVIRPEVVILCNEKVCEDSALPLRLIDELHCSRVVTLNLENNLIQVYSKHNVMVHGVTDLLSVIDVDFHLTCVSDKEVKYESFQADNRSSQ